MVQHACRSFVAKHGRVRHERLHRTLHRIQKCANHSLDVCIKFPTATAQIKSPTATVKMLGKASSSYRYVRQGEGVSAPWLVIQEKIARPRIIYAADATHEHSNRTIPEAQHSMPETCHKFCVPLDTPTNTM
jgi:hypothetical protein